MGEGLATVAVLKEGIGPAPRLGRRETLTGGGRRNIARAQALTRRGIGTNSGEGPANLGEAAIMVGEVGLGAGEAPIGSEGCLPFEDKTLSAKNRKLAMVGQDWRAMDGGRAGEARGERSRGGGAYGG